MDVALGSLSADMPDKGCKLEVVFKSDNAVKLHYWFPVVCASPYCYCQHRRHLKNGGLWRLHLKTVLVLIAQVKTVIFVLFCTVRKVLSTWVSVFSAMDFLRFSLVGFGGVWMAGIRRFRQVHGKIGACGSNDFCLRVLRVEMVVFGCTKM